MIEIEIETQYQLHTGNIFGISLAWVNRFEQAAREIVPYDLLGECQSAANPAFAGAWCVVFDKEYAQKVKNKWQQLMPLAQRSAPEEFKIRM